MRRLVTLACAVPVLLTMLSGPAAAVPPPGDEYYTSTQLARGLLTRTDLPTGYTVTGEVTGPQTGYPVFGSGLCSGFPTEIFASVSHASRSFTQKDGTTLRVSITATGSARALAAVGHLAEAPQKCPAANAYTALPLSGLGRPSAGLSSRDGHAVAIAYGNASAIFEEDRGTGQTRARFLEIVRAGAAKLAAIDGPSPVDELKRGLLDVTDLPAGHRLVAGGAVRDGSDWFTEYNCAGEVERFTPRGTAVRRSFATGAGRRATIRMAVGSIGTPGLAERVRSRLARCPSVIDESGATRVATPLSVPSTDITTVGIRYRGTPDVARAIIEYRDWYADVRITMTGDEQADAATVDTVVSAAMVHILAINER